MKPRLKRLYESIIEMIGTDLFDREHIKQIPLNMPEDKAGYIGIGLFGGSDEEDLCGDIVNRKITAQIQVNCEPDNADDLYEKDEFLREFIKRIETGQTTVEGIEFISCIHTGAEVKPVIVNGYNIPILTSSIDILYIFQEDEENE